MKPAAKKATRPKPGTVKRSRFKMVEITVDGPSHEGHLTPNVLGTCLQLAMQGTSAKVKLCGVVGRVTVTR